MKLKTSFCNFSLLKKNLTRFAPLWIIYLAAWLIGLTTLFSGVINEQIDLTYYEVTELMEIGNMSAFVYGVLLAMALFSYLFNARSTSMMHALPLRRSCIFTTNFLSGVLMFLVPDILITLVFSVGAGMLAGGVPLVFQWFLGMVVMNLFYFAFAVFIAMFTGQLAALPIFYGIYSFLLFVLHTCLGAFFDRMQDFGYAWQGGFSPGLQVQYATPVVNLMQYGTSWHSEGSAIVGSYSCLVIYGLLALLLIGLSYFVYSRRKSEWAGDIVTEPWARVVFRYGVGFTAAVTIGFVLSQWIFWNVDSRIPMVLTMAATGVVAFFVACVLLKKSFRVGRRAVFGGGVCALALIVLSAGVSVDLLGIARRVPDAERVISVRLSGLGYNTTLKSFANRESVEAIHQLLVNSESGEIDAVDSQTLRITYQLENGQQKQWSYSFEVSEESLADPESVAAQLQSVMDTKEFRNSQKLETLYWVDKDAYELMDVSLRYTDEHSYSQNWNLTPEEAEGLYDALLEDAAADRMPRVTLKPQRPTEEQYAEDELRPDPGASVEEVTLADTEMTDSVLEFYIKYTDDQGRDMGINYVPVVIEPCMTATVRYLIESGADPAWVLPGAQTHAG